MQFCCAHWFHFLIQMEKDIQTCTTVSVLKKILDNADLMENICFTITDWT